MILKELKEIIDKIPAEQLDVVCSIVEPHYRDEFPLVQARFCSDHFCLFGDDPEDDEEEGGRMIF